MFLQRGTKSVASLLVGTMMIGALPACEDLPGTRKEQGAVIGGVTGAAAGAVVAGEGNRLLGALLGGALGAAGGYIIGAESQKVKDRDRDSALKSSQAAQQHPATAADVRSSSTADLNNDGFVTLDEVVAMKSANLSDNEIVDRLRATNQIFDLNADQERYLVDHGVSQNVIDQMRMINRDEKNRVLGDVIGQPQKK
jgi:hypothetical protein